MKSALTILTFTLLLIFSNTRLEATVYLVSNIQEFNSAVVIVTPGDSIVLKKRQLG